MLDIFLAELELLLALLDTDEGRTELTAQYNEALATIGQTVRVDRVATTPVIGLAERVGRDGALYVTTNDGEVAIRTGDVVHLREETR
jgi:biotin-(acetyl-CoA carboxylase) ligase